MTPRAKASLKIILPFVGVIFLAGAVLQDVKHDISTKVDAQRFITDSVHRDGTNAIILDNQKETIRQLREINSRLKEVCIALKGRAGCL